MEERSFNTECGGVEDGSNTEGSADDGSNTEGGGGEDSIYTRLFFLLPRTKRKHFGAPPLCMKQFP